MERKKYIELFLMKFKYGLSSSIATAVDYGLYLYLVTYIFQPTISHLISAGTGMVINFIIQKRFIFDLNRKLHHAFLMSLAVSIGGIALGTLFIYLLNLLPFFAEHQFITKGLVTGVIFFYNFYLKRFAFEKKFL